MHKISPGDAVKCKDYQGCCIVLKVDDRRQFEENDLFLPLVKVLTPSGYQEWTFLSMLKKYFDDTKP